MSGPATNLSKYTNKERADANKRNSAMEKIRKLRKKQEKHWTNTRHQQILKLQK